MSPSERESLSELGRRLARVRLERNWTQATLAEDAGVSRATVKRLEAGRSTQLSSLFRILRTLGLASNLEALAPRPQISPLEAMKREGRRRRRATSSPAATRAGDDEPRGSWVWGDEPGQPGERGGDRDPS